MMDINLFGTGPARCRECVSRENVLCQAKRMRRSSLGTILYRVEMALLGMAIVAGSAFAQQYKPPTPDQPVHPQSPQLRPRAAQPPASQPSQPRQQPQPPFQLTPQQEAHVDRVLNMWEARNRKIKTFDCRFQRWTYDVVFGRPGEARFVELGVLKFATPDRGLFRVETTERDGRRVPIEDNRAEHWICDGRSIFKFDPAKKQVIEYQLPPEMRGKAIANSPLPFMFGAEAKTLKQRYYVRIITPPDAKDQVWLEAYPRYQEDAANFHHAQFIVTMPDMSPFALRLVEPNGKNYTVYQFYDIVVNDPLKFFKGDPFRPFTPLGWQRVVENHQPSQAQRGPASGAQR